MRLWFESALLPEGWRKDVRIDVANGLIAAVMFGVQPEPGDDRHGPAMPGLPNLHSHAFQRGMAGLAEVSGRSEDSFWTWRETMYRFVAALDPDTLQAIAALAYIEMLESGFTRVGEFHYLHHGPDGRAYDDRAAMAAAIAAAAQESGIALTLLPVFYAHADFGGTPPRTTQARFVNDLDGFARLIDDSRHALAGLDQAVIGVAPHSLRAVTAAELAVVTTLLPDAPIHIHIAEQTREVEACMAWSGQRPVEWLFDRAEVDRRWCLVHATHVVEAELRQIAASEAVVGLCPITEANLGDGLFPARAFQAQGGRFGVGSDSNVRIDAGEELRLLEYGQRLTHEMRNVLSNGPGRSTGATLWSMAFQGGARALGASGAGLAVGAPADLVSFLPSHPASVGRHGDQLIDSWVFGGARDHIDSVWRAGRKCVSGGRHHDRERITARYVDVMKGLLA
ncbi:N-formimino-L-glutamate deiminase [Sphingomonas sp. Leaf357]|uniref:formimidoylglutamate deiminase n=1 Tax=Sphingomonas sp. Leaf357 TaxID=1736350 RepID=UPI0006FC889B|nr:formimidoylglutamate deiminase [Sphingomonas sp. Leaf357]KQS05042.1 N-formimino-L-glutamate deiminase [Sphingomonas sp. Leaf357]